MESGADVVYQGDKDALLDILERIELIEKHGPRETSTGLWSYLILTGDKTSNLM